MFFQRLFALSLLATPLLQARTWTNNQGVKLEAELIGVKGNLVTIKIDGSGKEFTIEKSTLSKADQAYIELSDIAAEKPSPKKKAITEDPDLEKLMAEMKGEHEIVKAIKPNFNDPWPESVDFGNSPEIKVIEENADENRFIYHSAHYEFVCDVRLNGSVVKEFSKLFEATFLVMETLPMSFDRARNQKPGIHLPVRLFETRESYVLAGGPPDSGGVYLIRSNTIMVPLESLGVKKVGSGYARDFDSQNQTLAHELVHQLQDLVYDKHGSIGWFTEGIAEYVSMSPYKSGRFNFKTNLRDIAKSVMEYDYDTQSGSDLGAELTLTNLEGFMLQSYGEFTANGIANYAMGMLLTTYFIHMDDNGSRKNLNAYLMAMREGKDGKELLATLQAGRTWEELSKEIATGWRKYGLKLIFK